jgi:hypothetical protein
MKLNLNLQNVLRSLACPIVLAMRVRDTDASNRMKQILAVTCIKVYRIVTDTSITGKIIRAL